MKKRVLCLALALGMCAALCACSGEENPGSQPVQSQAPRDGQTEPAGGDRFVFQVSGHTVSVDDDMADVLAALGEAQSYFEAASCAFEGLDKTYTYAGFVITTRPDGERDFVSSIRLTDDSVTTVEGVYIGCGESSVTAAYGEGEGGEGVLSYTKGGTALNFVMEGGKVISIEYLAA